MFERRFLIVAATVILVALTGCDGGESDSGAEPGVVEVTAVDFEFRAPEEIPSGWTTFRFTNEGEQEHFFVLWKLPEGKTFRDHRTEVAGAFERVWNQYDSGELSREETLATLGSELPEWFFTDVVPSGGPALTEPGETSRTTVLLEPGTYVMECYVKTPQGTWHTFRGMLRELTVTTEWSEVPRPEPDAQLMLSNYEIAISGELTAGTRTVAVHVEENPEMGLAMHDINLFRLDGDTDLQEIVAWMDWMALGEFRAPAPGHSLGGVEHMLSGSTGYLTVDLEPGRYAWVSEGYAGRGMVEEFTIE